MSQTPNDRKNIAPPVQPTLPGGSRALGVGLIAGVLVFAGAGAAEAAQIVEGPQTAPKQSAPKQEAPKESPEAEVTRLEGEVQKLEQDLESAQKCEADKSAKEGQCADGAALQQQLKVRRERLRRARHQEKAQKAH